DRRYPRSTRSWVAIVCQNRARGLSVVSGRLAPDCADALVVSVGQRERLPERIAASGPGSNRRVEQIGLTDALCSRRHVDPRLFEQPTPLRPTIGTPFRRKRPMPELEERHLRMDP